MSRAGPEEGQGSRVDNIPRETSPRGLRMRAKWAGQPSPIRRVTPGKGGAASLRREHPSLSLGSSCGSPLTAPDNDTESMICNLYNYP